MAEQEFYRIDLVAEMHDRMRSALERSRERVNRFEQHLARTRKAAQMLDQQKIAPLLTVRDNLTASVLKADSLVKKLSLETAAPVLTAQERVSDVVKRMSEAVDAATRGQHDIALAMKPELLKQVKDAEKAVKAISGAKGNPYAELKGPLLKQLEQTKVKLAKLDMAEAEPLAKLRDQLSAKVGKSEALLQKLSLTQASPVIAAQDRVSAVVTRINAALDALDKGKVDVVADMKGPLIDEIVKAKAALKVLDDVKAGPVAELRGELFGQLTKAMSQLSVLDHLDAKPRATLVDRVSSGVAWAKAKLYGLVSRAWTVTIQAKDLVSGTVGRIGRALSSPLGLLGVGFGGAAAVKASILTPLDLSGQMEQAQISFETMLGSVEKARKFLGDLQNFAAKTPFEFPELRDSSKRLLAMGFAADEILPTMTAIGNAASGLGMGAEGMNRAILALGQMRAKAKVSAEEMMQLTELGIPAWDMLAKAMGKSTAQVMKMAEKGLIPADKAIRVLVDGMNRRFPDMMAKQSRSLFGLWSTIKDTFNMGILLRWGDGLSMAVKPRMENLVDLFTKNEDVIKRWGDTLERVAAAAGDNIMSALEGAFNKVDRIMQDPKFQKADLFGKTQILWDELIAKPFDKWWSSGGEQWAVDTGTRLGVALAKGIVGGVEFGVKAGVKAIGDAVAEAWNNPSAGNIGKAALTLGVTSAVAVAVAKRIPGVRPAARWLLTKGKDLFTRTPAAVTKETGAAIAKRSAVAAGMAGGARTAVGIGDIRAGYQLMRETGAGRIRSLVEGVKLAAETPRVVQSAGALGKMGRFVRFLGPVGYGWAIASDINEITSRTGFERTKAATRAVGGWSGAIGGAKLGALGGAVIGSFIPVIGTGIGGAIGGFAGGILGYFGGSALGDKLAGWFSKPGEKVSHSSRLTAWRLQEVADAARSASRALSSLRVPAYFKVPQMMPAHTPTQALPRTLPAHAVGGILTRPHLGLVAEAGPEAVIPLSSRLRSRALALWQETGQRLGVSLERFALGGFTAPVAVAGAGTGPVAGGPMVVHIHLDGAVRQSIEVRSAQDLQTVVSLAADAVAGKLRDVLANLIK